MERIARDVGTSWVRKRATSGFPGRSKMVEAAVLSSPGMLTAREKIPIQSSGGRRSTTERGNETDEDDAISAIKLATAGGVRRVQTDASTGHRWDEKGQVVISYKHGSTHVMTVPITLDDLIH